MGWENEDRAHRERHPSESVVIDIGGTIGALVVIAPQPLDGAEIEICPAGTSTRAHTIVRAREVFGGRVVYAGVFPSLPEGDYTLLAYTELPFVSTPEAKVRINGGAITQFSW